MSAPLGTLGSSRRLAMLCTPRRRVAGGGTAELESMALWAERADMLAARAELICGPYAGSFLIALRELGGLDTVALGELPPLAEWLGFAIRTPPPVPDPPEPAYRLVPRDAA